MDFLRSASDLKSANSSAVCSGPSSYPSARRRDSNACCPECFPRTSSVCFTPTDSGVMISYVFASAITPCWCMPLSCAKAFAPTMALFGAIFTPVMRESSWAVRAISSVRILQERSR